MLPSIHDITAITALATGSTAAPPAESTARTAKYHEISIKIFRLSRIENMKLWFASTSHVTWKDNPVMALFTGSHGSHDSAQATGSASKLDMSELATIVFGAGTLNHTLVSSVKPCSKRISRWHPIHASKIHLLIQPAVGLSLL